MRKAVERTEKAVHRMENDVGELKTSVGEMKDMLFAKFAHLNPTAPALRE